MMNLRAIRLTVFGLTLFLLAGGSGFAADGDVDGSFGDGLTRYEGSGVYAGVRQPDGKVIVGGSFRVANGRYYHGLARFNADGSIDTSFNIGNGQVIGGVVLAVALQADGKILVGGSFHDWNQPDFPQTREPRGYLVRLNTDGSIDPSFIGFGSQAGPNFGVNKIVVQPDGNILVSGSFWMFGSADVKQLIRLNPAGELDTAFNANLGTGFSGSSTGLPVQAIALQTNGQILIGGEFTSVNSVSAGRLARLNADGTLDTAFATAIGTGALGGGGVLSLAVQPINGKILLGGSFDNFNGTPRHLMARINQDGTLDTAFDSVAGNNGGIEAFAIQPDGRIIVTGANGAFTDGNNSRPAIARLNAEDGSLDLTFDPGTGTSATNLPVLLYEPADGSVYVGGNFFAFNDTPRLALTRLNANGSLHPNFKPIIGHQANVNVLAVQADDKVLVGGDFHGAGNLMSPKIARYNADGSVDTSFDAFSPGYIDSEVKAIAVQEDGKILIGGSFTYFGGVNKAGIARLNADGSRDPTFNGETTGTVNSIVVQADGKIVIGGSFFAVNGTLGHFGIARLNADGTTDTTFPATGCGANCAVEKITQQPDGKFLVGGTFSQFNGISGIENMVRLNADGTLDNSFNVDCDSTVEDIVVQTDGKILVTGWFGTVNGTSSSRLVRLNTNGTIDGTFSVGAGLDWTGISLAIQPNGKIIVVGYFGGYQGMVRRNIIRINANGMLDTTFAEQVDPLITLNAVALDSHGKVIVGGYFNKYQNARRYSIARLKNDGLNPTWGEDSTITIPDGNLDPDSQIGGAVAIDGDTAVVGDLADNGYQGAAYIYVRNGTNWTLQQKLTASDGAANDWFGVRVAIDGDTVIIGASQDNIFQGSAYIFVRNGTTWTEHQKLTAIDGAENDNFGLGVAIDGDFAVIGSSDDDIGGILNQGSAYVYQRIGTSWLFAQKLTALDGAAADGFGWSVSISGGRIIIGAPGGIGGNTSPGSAYIFVNIAFQWQQQQKITASDGVASDGFGRSVSIDGDYAVIGSRNSVYIFVGNAVEWNEQQKLTAIDNGNPNSCGLGESVSISGNRVVAGCPYDRVVTGQFPGPESNNWGAAYIFVRNGMIWTQEVKLRGLDTNGGDYFGTAVAISGNTVIVGAPEAFWNGGNFGAAYIFVLSGSNWFQQKKLIVETEVPSALFGGSVAIFGNTAVIGASGVNNNRGAAYIYVRNGTTWTYKATLLAPDGESFDQFGYSVSIYFNKIIIGAPGDDSDKGSAYVFIENTGENWDYLRKLTDPEGESMDYFGSSVSIQPQFGGANLIVGSPGDTVNGVANKGSATIFYNDNVSLKLTASDGQESDGFGTSVSYITDTQVVIGSPSNGVSGNQGAAYHFQYDCFQPGGCSWIERQKLTASDGTGNNLFGTSVAGVFGNSVIIGASGDNSSQGAAYIFNGIQNLFLTEAAKLTAFDGLPNDRFGQSVAISGDNVIVGAPFDDIGSNTDQGSAYIFTRNDTSWNFRQKLLSNNSAADLYGFSVAISGGITLVGALNVDVFPSLAERRRQTANIVGTDQGEVTFYGLQFLVPTAAQVSVGGRVLTGKGNALSRVIVTLTDSNGATRTVSTNTFGYYRFDEVRAGETYTVSVSHKKLQFNPSSRVINVQEDVSDMDFLTEY